MNRLVDTDTDSRTDTHPGDREISLGTGTILGIFFAVALVCAAFFGFGYTLGRKSAQASFADTAAAQPAAPAPSTVIKPAAGSPAKQPSPVTHTVVDDPPPPAAIVEPPPPRSTHTIDPADTIIVGDKLPAPDAKLQDPRLQAPKLQVAGPQLPPGPQQVLPPITPGGAFMVQIAAVSSQEIADIELAALKKYGYAVVVRHEPQDTLLHVQVGPFATRKEAEAMRQNIIAHGFNAIVK